MKQRIRTIKPEFFTHEVLFDAEKDCGLPLRLAFVGLWTCCDRDGRFEWRPRPLKTHIMPYDDVDFSRVLDALATRGFVVKYASDGKEYGCIPSWARHQVVNNREAASDIPDISEGAVITYEMTREPRVDDASQSCTSGREGKGRELEGKGRELEGAIAPLSSSDDVKAAFDAYNAMAERAGIPQAQAMTDKRKSAIRARLKSAGGIDGWMVALGKVENSPHCTGQNDRGWKADLDFICTEAKFVNIMEGRYDRSANQQSRRGGNAGRGSAHDNLLAGFQASAADEPRGGLGF